MEDATNDLEFIGSWVPQYKSQLGVANYTKHATNTTIIQTTQNLPQNMPHDHLLGMELASLIFHDSHTSH